MKTMWRGAISFGLVSIPVRVYTATEEKTLRFNQLHEKDHGRIRYKRVCGKDDQEVPYEEIVRGYEYEKDHYVILTDEDMESVPVESTRTIDIQQFVDVSEIDPIYYKKTYYLGPEEAGVKAYQLLRQSLEEGNRVGIAKVAFRDKEHLAAVRLMDNVLVLDTMFWPDEIRKADFPELDKDVKVSDKELSMAQSLIENLTEPFKPDAYRDEYREALLEVVEKKVAGEEIEYIEAPEPAKVVDLMEALKQSVEDTKKAAAPKRKTPAKKTGAKRKKAAS
ncbi:MAG TPA: Ku protein [Actinomycetota bacterium]|nr:Ku protein [Actinomycetota bacterium]